MPGRCVALIQPAAVLAGPTNDILEVSGAALAPDGTGGVLYRAQLNGVTHLFVVRFANGGWEPPVEVDTEDLYGASDPVIAAGDGGRLLVAWVQPRNVSPSDIPEYELITSSLQPGTNGFGQAIMVDPEVGEKFTGDVSGVDPRLAMAPNGAADIVYRVTVNDCGQLDPSTGTVCPPNSTDKLVLVRFAHFKYLTWSQPKTINRAPQIAMRSPTVENAPSIGIDLNGNGVVAWQEPGADRVARIWVRRLFGSELGNVLQASPEQIEGRPVSTDADAPAISVNAFGEARIAYRIQGSPGSAVSSPEVFVNSLPSSIDPHGYALTGSKVVTSAVRATLGLPSVSIDEEGNYRLAWTQEGSARELSGSRTTGGAPVEIGQSTALQAFSSINPAGGGTSAWAASQSGSAAVAIREDYGKNAFQVGQRAGTVPGPVSGLAVAGDGQGDTLLGWMQGSVGNSEVVGDFVQAPPAPFEVSAPIGWVSPTKANISWSEAPDAMAGVTYTVYIDGKARMRGLTGLSAHLRSLGLGDGKHRLQILASDAAGQQTMSVADELQLDANPPIVTLRYVDHHQGVLVAVRDRASGVKVSATKISFGDGTRLSGHAKATHVFRHAGFYTITVRVRDKVGNSATDHLKVKVR
ncbi:MAG TPA: PKD domain-containing protein [Solirubrobacteraceae bacterium]|nr:PKD domain-containing protein [Solirubrobacteraceae bacterium]